MNRTKKDIKVNNNQVNTRKINYGDHKDVLLWYTKVHEVIKEKSCENTQVKFTLTELLLEGQGLIIFLQLKTIVTKKDSSR